MKNSFKIALSSLLLSCVGHSQINLPTTNKIVGADYFCFNDGGGFAVRMPKMINGKAVTGQVWQGDRGSNEGLALKGEVTPCKMLGYEKGCFNFSGTLDLPGASLLYSGSTRNYQLTVNISSPQSPGNVQQLSYQCLPASTVLGTNR